MYKNNVFPVSTNFALNADLPIELIKYLFVNIEFNCDFKNNVCKLHRTFSSDEKKDPKCCCFDCAKAYGHFNKGDLITKESSKFLNRRYSEKTGFWRKNIGCIIPRKWRSFTCTTYTCTRVHPDEREKLMNLIKTLDITSARFRKK